MTELINFKKDHLLELLEEDNNHYLGGILSSPHAEAIENLGTAFTVMRDDGKVICCGGITDYWPGRGEIWCVFTKNCTKEFIAIHRAGLKIIKNYAGKRIEAAVEIGFEKGHRWIRALGFTLDAPFLKSYLPTGGDVALYSITK